MTERVKEIIDNYDTYSVASVTEALEKVKEINDFEPGEKIILAKALSEIFFHAHYTGSTLMPRLAVQTEKRIAKFGKDIIPFVFTEILESDSESVVFFGQTLAKIGAPGLDYIIDQFPTYEAYDANLINLLQVLSYFKIPEAIGAIPPLLLKTKHPNHQIAAMALYSVGRLIQRLKANLFSDNLKNRMFESVFGALSHSQGLVRKNAVRTLGKMLRKGLLTQEQEEKVYKVFLAITGKDEHHSWDRAFIVRREAEVFLPFFKKTAHPSGKYSQSFRILSKKLLCINTYHFTLDAPLIARKIEAGQFIIIRPHILSERIPLSVCGWDREQGILEIIVSTAGKTTMQINAMKPGETFQDIVGPLGERSVLPEEPGTCVVIGGGYGTGAILPSARDMKALGHKVIGIVGARSHYAIIMIDELKQVCDEVLITTNDGSLGIQGFVTHGLQSVLDLEHVIYVLAVGPVPMMKAVSEMTRELKIATYVSLNAIMVDGTGMCGACRVSVGGETKFACFHGPDFDGHKVDFENLMMRQKMFAKEEGLAFSGMKI